MEFLTNFCGANARLLSEDGDVVCFENELRDTIGDWFYWAFAIRGAAGRTITFSSAPKRRIGCLGAAVSRDLVHWEWTGTMGDNGKSFTYTFADDEIVYFAHHMLYHPSRFHRFCEKKRIPVQHLCDDRENVPVPYITLGDGASAILLIARQHCCESTGDYIMEGMLDEFSTNPWNGYKIIAIPFMNAAGVVAGDQGKSRAPHDHNRDYLDEPLYPSVRKVKEFLAAGNVKALFDLHSPGFGGGANDTMAIVRSNFCDQDKMLRMGRLFMEEITPGAMRYDQENDIKTTSPWNKPEEKKVASEGYSMLRGGTEIAFALETTYYGLPEDPVTQDKLIETGRCFARAIRRYFEE
ncbi:MAG: hypothetical protein J6C52_03745 [Clostridia bacterium]|nr:hypothetical protein [Clostridia bacterium]